MLGEAFRGTNKDLSPVFGIAFLGTKALNVSTIIHECWHLFFFILSYWDSTKSETFVPDELAGETYAHLFEHLVSSVISVLVGTDQL